MSIGANSTLVMGPRGMRGRAIRARATQAGAEVWVIELDQGGRFAVPIELVQQRPDGSLDVSLELNDLQRFQIDAPPTAEPAAQTVIPVAREELRVGVRSVETGRVIVHKTVHERDQVIDEPLLVQEFDIQRVPVNRYVQEAPPVRQEGHITIIPVVEEVPVVQKRLLLREEVHLIRRTRQERRPQTVSLRYEQAHVERVLPGASQSGVSANAPSIEQHRSGRSLQP